MVCNDVYLLKTSNYDYIVFRKNIDLQGDCVTNDENKVTNLNCKSVKQTSRPYKIKDINKLDISFPTTIIKSISGDVKLSNDDVIARIKALQHNNINAIKPRTTSTIIRQNVTTEQVAEDYEDTALDEQLPEISNLETVDFNIDHSMFNPKTLLQCLTKDDDMGFVPPPVEFRDEITTSHEAFGSPAADEFEDNGLNYPDRSIFDTDSHPVLTPTKEIETWTFSRDDNEYTTFEPRESCTVMRKKTPVPSTAAYNVPHKNRKANLGQFTYKVKSKLKI